MAKLLIVSQLIVGKDVLDMLEYWTLTRNSQNTMNLFSYVFSKVVSQPAFYLKFDWSFELEHWVPELIETLPFNPQVMGSIPTGPTKLECSFGCFLIFMQEHKSTGLIQIQLVSILWHGEPWLRICDRPLDSKWRRLPASHRGHRWLCQLWTWAQ